MTKHELLGAVVELTTNEQEVMGSNYVFSIFLHQWRDFNRTIKGDARLLTVPPFKMGE